MVSSLHNAPRYEEYGVFDAYTGELISKHPSRSEANSARNQTGNYYGCRVRGIKRKAQR